MAGVTAAQVRRVGARTWKLVRPSLPDLRDLHVYGGGLLMAYGIASVYAPAAAVLFGGLLVYLGTRRAG